MSDHDIDKPILSERQLDAALDASPELQPSADLLRRVAQIPIEYARQDALTGLWPFASLWRAAVSASFAIVLGVGTGLLSATPVEADDDLAELSTLTYGTDWDLEELP